MKGEDPIDLLTEAQEETNRLLGQIVVQLKKPANLSKLEDAIDDQTDVLRELVQLEAQPDEPDQPVINVSVPEISVPQPVVNVSVPPASTVVVQSKAKRYLSVVTRDSYGNISQIETTVIE